jgi:site-specific DNA-methyltransferase (adenine-specific)
MTDLGPYEVDTIVCENCLSVMAKLPDSCIDTIITDPPYGLEFMGKEWDKLDGVDRRQPGDPTFHTHTKTGSNEG